MTYETQRSQALAILEKTGIWRSNYAPPYLRLLWSMGIKAAPPHFVPYPKTVLFAGFWFAVAWRGAMWLSLWSSEGMSAKSALVTASVGGIFFGFAMATYYAYGRRKYQLPDWQSLAGG
jgi:hypothetical protein